MWKTQQGSFTGTGTISGHGVGKSSERNSVSGRLSRAVFTGTRTISGHGVGKSSERNSVSGRLSKAVSLVQFHWYRNYQWTWCR